MKCIYLDGCNHSWACTQPWNPPSPVNLINRSIHSDRQPTLTDRYNTTENTQYVYIYTYMKLGVNVRGLDAPYGCVQSGFRPQEPVSTAALVLTSDLTLDPLLHHWVTSHLAVGSQRRGVRIKPSMYVRNVYICICIYRNWIGSAFPVKEWSTLGLCATCWLSL